MLSIHDWPAVGEYCRRRKIDRHHLRLLQNAFYKRQFDKELSLAQLPAEHQQAFAEQVAFHSLQLQGRHDSQVDGASKLIFRTDTGLLLESVILRIASGRTALCVSTQVGCAAGCCFCATGTMGLARNLSAGEILDQVIWANALLKTEQRAIRNVVFMGMGEPFHNEDALYQSIERLCSPRGCSLSPRRILVSTVGVPEAMVRFADRFPRVGLALSLHSARQALREQMIPLARRYTLPQLRAAVAHVTAVGRQPVMIEYILFEDLNDTAQDVQALTELWAGIAVHINLIPYNPIEAAPGLIGTDNRRRKAFAACLRDAGFTVTVRYSLGADVAAACGQLVRRQETQREIARLD
jgi:23S rRNA (adenine2503-C2)-methyltransferase